MDPDPLETVTLLKSDFDLLQAAANAAMEDYTNLVQLLRLDPPQGIAPRQFMHDVMLPMIAQLVTTQHAVDEASKEIRERAAALGNKTVELPGGQKGLLVGKKDPTMFMNREQRRAR